MNTNFSDFVFLTDCADLGEAQVLKSFLESEGLHPRVRDLHTRTMASHLSNALGKLTVEIPSSEFVAASLALEKRVPIVTELPPVEESHLRWTQDLAKKALWNSILGLFLIPLLPNFYSMILGYRVLKNERPTSRTSMVRLFWAIVFNSVTFITWLVYLPHFLKEFLNSHFPSFF